MTQTVTLPLTEVASLIWNDAACECCFQHPDIHPDPYGRYARPCDECLVDTYDEKVSELSDKFIDSIMEIGIQEPIYLSDDLTRVMNGHHRLALAIMLMLDEVPVTTEYDNSDDGANGLPFSYAS